MFKGFPIRTIKNSFHVYFQRLRTIFKNLWKTGNISILSNMLILNQFFQKSLTDKSNYGTVSTLSNLSKVFETLYDQMNSCIEPKLSKVLMGFFRSHNT